MRGITTHAERVKTQLYRRAHEIFKSHGKAAKLMEHSIAQRPTGSYFKRLSLLCEDHLKLAVYKGGAYFGSQP